MAKSWLVLVGGSWPGIRLTSAWCPFNHPSLPRSRAGMAIGPAGEKQTSGSLEPARGRVWGSEQLLDDPQLLI